MSLTDWARNGWLVEHRTSPQEIADLLGVVDRDLHDGAVKHLSEDWLRQNHSHLPPTSASHVQIRSTRRVGKKFHSV